MTIILPMPFSADADAFFEVFFASKAGVPRGKRRRRHEIKAVYLQGRFDRSVVLRDYPGDHFVDMFACVKRTGQARFFEQVTMLDYGWYPQNA